MCDRRVIFWCVSSRSLGFALCLWLLFPKRIARLPLGGPRVQKSRQLVTNSSEQRLPHPHRWPRSPPPSPCPTSGSVPRTSSISTLRVSLGERGPTASNTSTWKVSCLFCLLLPRSIIPGRWVLSGKSIPYISAAFNHLQTLNDARVPFRVCSPLIHALSSRK